MQTPDFAFVTPLLGLDSKRSRKHAAFACIGQA
jgi:hypothetical protein